MASIVHESHNAQSSLLPIFTALIGSGGLINGLHHLKSPEDAARLYGVPIPEGKEQLVDDRKALKGLPRWQASYVFAYGSRNFATGLTIIGLSAYWRYSPAWNIPLASHAIQRCLGIVILAGSSVPVFDAVITNWASKEAARDDAERKVGVKASIAHALRSVIWMAVGGACLLG